jgi:hypothetical protein
MNKNTWGIMQNIMVPFISEACQDLRDVLITQSWLVSISTPYFNLVLNDDNIGADVVIRGCLFVILIRFVLVILTRFGIVIKRGLSRSILVVIS